MTTTPPRGELFTNGDGKTFANETSQVLITTSGLANFTMKDGSTTGNVNWVAGTTIPFQVSSVSAGASAGAAAGVAFCTPLLPAQELLTSAAFFIDASNSVVGEQVAANRGTGGMVLDARYGSTSASAGDINDPLLLPTSGESYLYLPGIAGNYSAAVSAPEYDIRGDIEVVVRVAQPLWVGPGQQNIFGRSQSASNQYQWQLGISVGGALAFQYSLDGIAANATNVGSTTFPALSWAPNSVHWIKVTRRRSDGRHQFWYADDQSTEPTTWTQAGTDVISGAGSTLFGPSTSPLEFNTRNAGATVVAPGSFYRAILRNGINGTAVFDVNFSTGITSGGQVSVPCTGTGVAANSAPQYLSNLGTGGRALVARTGASGIVTSNDPNLLPWTGTNYLYLPAVIGNYASAPDAAPLKITGDIDIVVRVALDDWTPAAANTLCAKESSSTARSYRLHVTSASRLAFVYAADGTTIVTATSTVSLSVTDGSAYWVRVTRASGSGDVNFYYAADQATEPTTWTQLGTTVLGATGALFDSTSPVEVGTVFGGGQLLSAGKFYRAIVRNGIGGTTVFDADFTTGITSGAQTTFTESSSNAATVTINRSTAGRKCVAVTRPTLIFGTDDYIEVADNALLNFGATDSFTVVAAVRQWTAPVSGGGLIYKNDGSIGTGGWRVVNSNATGSYRLDIGDTVNTVLPTNISTALGSLHVVGGTRIAGTTVTTLLDNTGTSLADTTTGSLSNTLPLRIGATSAVTPAGYQDFEFFGAAVFRRALTSLEVALINTHYQGIETPDSVALLSTAVLWIDASRSQQELSIIRSTTGRKSVCMTGRGKWLFGTDDYMEVADNALLNMDASQSFTVVAVVRQWATPTSFGRYVDKSISGATGWSVESTAGLAVFGLVSDGVNSASRNGLSTFTAGSLTTIGQLADRTGQTLATFSGSTLSTTASTATVGTLSNALPMRIGSNAFSTGGSFQDFELLAVAVFRRALTAAEIAQINNYYGTA